jgi:transposase
MIARAGRARHALIARWTVRSCVSWKRSGTSSRGSGGRLEQARAAFFAQPVAFAADGDDVAVVAEFGLVGPQGPCVPRLLASMQEDRRVPELARQVLELLAAQLDEVGQRIAEVDAPITAWHKANPVSRRLATIPSIGPLIATAIAATVWHNPAPLNKHPKVKAWLAARPRWHLHFSRPTARGSIWSSASSP